MEDRNEAAGDSPDWARVLKKGTTYRRDNKRRNNRIPLVINPKSQPHRANFWSTLTYLYVTIERGEIEGRRKMSEMGRKVKKGK